ncbi:MAG: hypothetical protein V4463_01810 [Pseudomonadota bacterium]
MRKPAAAKATVKKTAVAKPAARKPAAKPATPAKAAAPAVRARPAPRRAAPKAVAEPVRETADKQKLVRDSFTMPEQEYAALGQVKKACLKAGFDIKKSELLRIGVAMVSQIDVATLRKVLSDLPQLKTGRPKNG